MTAAASVARPMLPIEKIRPDPTNRRIGDIAELTESVRAKGVLIPVLVREHPEGAPYMMVAGHRRLAAAAAAGHTEIPYVLTAMTDQEVIEARLVENVQRQDMHPLEEAADFQLLREKHKRKPEQIAARIGKPVSYVYRRLQLLKLGVEARAAYETGQIAGDVAMHLARVHMPELQARAVTKIVGSDMTGRSAIVHIQNHCMLLLEDAPFPIDDGELVAAAGSCTKCLKRTGTQAALFGVTEEDDRCTDQACYDGKRVAFAQLQVKRAKKAGQKVLTAEEAGFSKHGDLDWKGKYSDANTTEWTGQKREKLKEIVGEKLTPVLALDHDGDVHELYERKKVDPIVEALVEKAEEEKIKENAGEDNEELKARREKQKRADDERERLRKESEAKQRALATLRAQLVARAEKGIPDAAWPLLAAAILPGNWSVTQRLKWTELDETQAHAKARALPAAKARGIVVDCLLDSDNTCDEAFEGALLADLAKVMVPAAQAKKASAPKAKAAPKAKGKKK